MIRGFRFSRKGRNTAILVFFTNFLMDFLEIPFGFIHAPLVSNASPLDVLDCKTFYCKFYTSMWVRVAVCQAL